MLSCPSIFNSELSSHRGDFALLPTIVKQASHYSRPDPVITSGSTGPLEAADLEIHPRTEQLGHFVTVKSFLQVGHTVTTLIIIGQNPLFPRSQTWNCDRG